MDEDKVTVLDALTSAGEIGHFIHKDFIIAKTKSIMKWNVNSIRIEVKTTLEKASTSHLDKIMQSSLSST